MTENEAIEIVRMMPTTIFNNDEDTAKRMAIQALEEIQQYRAIGTVEECRTAVERMKPRKPKIQSRGVYDEDNGDWMRDEIWHMCPTCRIRNEVYPTWKLCHYCGQVLDWSE